MLTLDRREFIKLSAAVAGALFTDRPVEQEWEVAVDEDILSSAISVGGCSKDLGRLNCAVYLDIKEAWKAVRLIDPAGNIYTTRDQGITWENGWKRLILPT